MTLEEGLEPLAEGEWELGGLRLKLHEDGDDGLDDIAEIDDDVEAAAGDGDAEGSVRLASRPVALKTIVGGFELPDGGQLTSAQFAGALDELRKVMSPLPSRSQLRLLRWRRPGEVAKRLWVKPATGKPMSVPGDQRRLVHQAAEASLKLIAPNPVICSDDLHTRAFTAGATHTITNAGSFTALHPTAWGLTAPGGVIISHGEFDEWIRFPTGPLTVTPERVIDGTSTFGIAYGPSESLFPRWPLLRPGDNSITASAVCTFTWRDTW